MQASHSDLLPVEVWEDYEHLLNEGNLEIDVRYIYIFFILIVDHTSYLS